MVASACLSLPILLIVRYESPPEPLYRMFVHMWFLLYYTIVYAFIILAARLKNRIKERYHVVEAGNVPESQTKTFFLKTPAQHS